MQTNAVLVKLVAGFMVAMALIALPTDFFVYRHIQHFVATASHSPGKVTKLVEENGNHHIVYFPVFEFRDAYGQRHEIDSHSGSYPPEYEVGDKISVLYQTDKPDNATIDSFWNIWIWPVVLGVFGATDLIIGVGLLMAGSILQRRGFGTLS